MQETCCAISATKSAEANSHVRILTEDGSYLERAWVLDAARHWLALILVVAFPPAFLYWFVIHPFTDFWRRLGPWKIHLIVGPSMILLGVGIYWLRDSLMRVDFGFVPAFADVGPTLHGEGAEIRASISRRCGLASGVWPPRLGSSTRCNPANEARARSLSVIEGYQMFQGTCHLFV